MFKLNSKYKPSGDQPRAIDLLSDGVMAGIEHQTLLGATGTGKTFTMANVIQNVQKPALVLAHNKTLAAQLFTEFKEFFPENSVQYFVSYYDYYQPEAYVPSRDLFIEKDSDINETIERYRSAATQALLTRKDVIIVASVSCIYGLGNPEDYLNLSTELKVGENYDRNKLIRHLIDMQYNRSDYEFYTGDFRVRGDTVDINVAADEEAVRIEYFGDTIERITVINPVSGEVTSTPSEIKIFPAKQYVTPFEKLKAVIPTIQKDLDEEVEGFKKAGREIEAMRLRQRVNFDIEMLQETGTCKGIENYSRYIEGRVPGSAPSCLLDYYPDDWLMFVDESHMTMPQVRGMFNGDRARKETLVNYGFRMKAAIDNRPLKFEEFQDRTRQMIYVSATPSEYELNISKQATSQVMASATPDTKRMSSIAAEADLAVSSDGPNSDTNARQVYQGVAQQIIRPTGLLDPIIEVRPSMPRNLENLQKYLIDYGYEDMPTATAKSWELEQIPNLIKEIEMTVAKGQRVLVTTLTKKMSEELTSFLVERNVKTQYIHSDVDAIKRVEILRELRMGKYDVLVGINLLREGLDLPEVSLVAILDADKEGFLRSDVSLIQTTGRAARHSEGRVIMYGDKVTDSMRRAIDETRRRRAIQEAHNSEHGITPTTIVKAISSEFEVTELVDDDQSERETELAKRAESFKAMKKPDQKRLIKEIEMQMEMFADLLEYEKAAEMRDLLNSLKAK